MRVRTGSTLAVAAAGLLVGTAVHVHAAEIGLLEMLFGARPAPQVQQAPADSGAYGRPSVRSAVRLGAARNRLRARYAALPVRIHVKERDASERQTPIDMKAGAAAAFMKDETLRPGDIVVLTTGARVFAGEPDKRHAMRDFEPVQSSAYVSKGTRKLLAGMLNPVGALPADEARRVVARLRRPAPSAATSVPTQAAAMRVINVWQTGQ